jgi:putative transposase
MLKTFKYRLYPTPAQEYHLELCLSAARNWYNMCLAERKCSYDHAGRSVGVYEQFRLVKCYKTAFRQFRSVHSHILQVATTDCDKAFEAFFRRLKAGDTPGYPRFRGKQRFDSFGFKEYGNGFKIDGRRLKVSGVGRIAVLWHRPLSGKIKTLRIRRTAGKWYACFSCEVPDPTPLNPTGKQVGIDLNVENLLTDSTGERIETPGYYRKAQADLRIVQRSLQRKKRGSKNRRKALLRVQRLHEHIRNQRQDLLNKVVDQYTQRHDLIALEDLHITNMVRNRHLSKSILDAGWGYLRQRFVVKAANAGRQLVLVDPAYTSKTCSCCGQLFHKFDLSTRYINCACGLRLARDHNAAINILKRATTGPDGSVRHNVDAVQVMRASEAARREP